MARNGVFLSIKSGRKSTRLPPFFYFCPRFGFFGVVFLADFEDDGGGVFNSVRNPASKLTPGNFRFNDFPMWFECG